VEVHDDSFCLASFWCWQSLLFCYVCTAAFMLDFIFGYVFANAIRIYRRVSDISIYICIDVIMQV